MDRTITLSQRAAFYRAAFPNWPAPFTTPNERWLYGVWILGQNYRGAAMYGSYPPNYLARVHALFLDRGRTLHLFSGTLTRPPDATPGWTAVDLRRTEIVRPTVQGSAQALPFAGASFDFAVCDPPYSKPDAVRYGTPMIVRAKVFRELARVVAPGGVVVWLDCAHPQYAKVEWDFFGFFAVVRSTNHRYRGVTMFQRREAVGKV